MNPIYLLMFPILHTYNLPLLNLVICLLLQPTSANTHPMLTLSKTDHSRPKAFFANSSAIIEPYPIKKELKVLNGNKP